MGHRYTATTERDETGTWVATVPDVPGVVTQSRRLDQLTGRVEEAVAAILDTDDTIEILLDVTLPDRLAAPVDDARTSRADADTAAARASQASRLAARALHDDGMPIRDVGVILGISHQRVAQLLH
jgi:predicted RNase H-like HicB family nuclease